MSNFETEVTVIEGEYTDAVVFLPRGEIENEGYKQIQRMVNHPAFRDEVRVMPDTHWGAGAPIGFTMPLRNRVVPNVVGVDIGCGMESVRLDVGDEFDFDDSEDLLWVDEEVRSVVPMGREVHEWDDDNYHMGEDFPYDEFREKWVNFATNHLDDSVNLGEYHPDEFDPDIEYFKELCDKVHYDLGRAIRSVASLGGGNHFVEFGVSDRSGDIWCTIHSGSRGLGKSIAEYHQERAGRLRDIESARRALRELPDGYLDFVKFDLESVSDHDLLDWLQGGMGESFVDYEALKEAYAGTGDAGRIEEIGNELKSAIPDHEGGGDLAYLEGEEAVEYYVDLAFGQTYALENRRVMAELIAEALGVEVVDSITAVHNYIDYEDGVIRKGATPAREGERAVVPMNMADGSFVVRGKGNEEWNSSVCHGAGRVMSRTEARDTFSEENHAERMNEVVATELPVDEHPDAYKKVSLIKDMMEPSVEVVDRLEPVLNLKASE